MKNTNNFPCGLYWVKVKVIAGTTLYYDWALGIIRNGHFEWLNRYAFDGRVGLPVGITLQPITLKELIDQKVPIVPIEKPTS